MEEEGVVGGGEEGERGVVPVKTLAGSEDPAPLSLALDSNGGYYTLGPPSPHTLLHTLSLTLHTTNNMPTPPSPHSQWYFYYRLLGNEITSEPFAPPTFQTERASIRILSSRESLGQLLASQEDIELHLCAGGQSCCHGNLPLRALSSSDSLTQTVELRGGQTPPPTVDVTLQLESSPSPLSHSTPSPSTTHAPGGKTHMQLPPSEPRPPAPPSPSPSPPPPPTHPPEGLDPTRPTGLQHNPLPSSLSPPHPPLPSSLSPPHTQEHPSPSSLVQSARRNLTRSFEEASQQTTPTRQQTTPTRSKTTPTRQQTIPMPTRQQTTPTRQQTTPPSKVDFGIVLHKMAPLSTVPSTTPTVPLPSSHPPPIPLTEVHTTMNQATAVERQEVGVARTASPAHHFRFSVDVRSIHNLQMGASLSCFLKYSYPFFGSPHPVLVLPPVTVSANSEQTFSQSYCTFDFATSPLHLISQLHTHPLNIEVWQSRGEGGRSHDQLVGVAKLSLSEVLTCEKVEVGGGEGGGVTRQLCSLRVPVTPPHSPLTTSGYLHTILVLEDHGPIRLAGVDGGTHTTTDKLGASSHASLPVGSVEYQAALELEMWKMAEEEAFQKQLREREEAHMSRLVHEWQQREDQRQTIVKQKLERYSELECQLQTTLRDVQQQQTQLKQREAKLSQERDRLTQECEGVRGDVEGRVTQVQAQYEQRLQLERLRVEDLQAQVHRLNKQVLEWEQRCASREAEFEAYRQQLLTKPESRLQAELSMLQLEKAELERKLSAASRSKQHYKEQWSKALRELASARQREQAAARDRLRRQQQELEAMRTRLLQSEEHRDIRRELSHVRNEVTRLQEHTHPPPPTNPPPTHSQPSQEEGEGELDAEVARWIEERDILLQTGVYTSSDPTIQRLDQRIRDSLVKRTQ